MRTLIVYATKYGATEKIAYTIANHLNSATLCNLAEKEVPSISDYDCVIIGSPITAGMVRKEIKTFTNEHMGELKGKRLGLFLSGIEKAGETTYFNHNFAPELLNAAAAKSFLGGIFDPDKCGLMARKVVQLIAKLDTYTSTIDEGAVAAFAKEMLQV